MYNRDLEFEEIWQEANTMPSEMEITAVRKTVKKRVFRHRIINTARNLSIFCVAALTVLIIGVNTSTAFAQTLSQIPFFKQLVDAVSFNEGYQDMVNNDALVPVGQTRETMFGDITLSYYVADTMRGVFFFEADHLNSGVQKDQLSIYITSVKNLDTGEEIECADNVPNFEDKYAVTDIDSWLEIDYPKHLELTAHISHPEIGEEDISYQVDLEDPLPEKVFEVNKSFEVQGQKFYIEQVSLYPTCTTIQYREDENNSMDIITIDFHLVDKDGNERGERRTITRFDETGNSTSITIAGGYFTLGDQISLVVDQLDLLPRNKRMVTFHKNTMEFTDEEGVLQNVYVLNDGKSISDDIYEKCLIEANRWEADDLISDIWENGCIPFLITGQSEKTIWNTFDIPEEDMNQYTEEDDDENLFWGTYTIDNLKIQKIPRGIQYDKDGNVRLVREFAEYYHQPDIVIPIN